MKQNLINKIIERKIKIFSARHAEHAAQSQYACRIVDCAGRCGV